MDTVKPSHSRRASRSLRGAELTGVGMRHSIDAETPCERPYSCRNAADSIRARHRFFKVRPSPFQEFNIVLGTRRRESRSTDGNCLLYRLGVRRRPALRSASL
jgi:hypothetical protein